MLNRRPVILRAADQDRAERPFQQRLNPSSKFSGAWLGRLAGLERAAVSRARVPPGGESFAYHAHAVEEEWIYVLQGRAVARIDGDRVELGPGDFVAFPAPQAPHLLTNPYGEELVYLMGGERTASDVLTYPDLGKRFALVRDGARVAFHELGPATFPFGPADRPATEAPSTWRVLGTRGCGSVIVEAALTLAEIPFEHEEVDYATPGPARDRLLAVNPLGQVPTIVLPSGEIMTESAAAVMLVDDLVPDAGLLPRPRDPLRAEALRWLVHLVAAVYPTWTYGDEPAKWVGPQGDALRTSTDEHRKTLWKRLEQTARGPWFLGPRFSAIDVYVAVMNHWRPGRAWFAENCPKLSTIADTLRSDRRLAALFAANFDVPA